MSNLQKGWSTKPYRDSNSWPYAKELGESAVLTRVDFAKFAVHNSIISSSNPEQIFIEDILNIFLALVQHPLNFIFYDEHMECIFHMCNDPLHWESFEKYVGSLHDMKESTCFECFNYSSKEPKRYVSIVYMDTKRHGDYVVIEKCDNLLGQKPILTEKEYISVCAQLFFSDRWSTLYSCSSTMFMLGIRNSLDELSNKYKAKKLDIAVDTPQRSVQRLDIKMLLNRISGTLAGIEKSTSYVCQLAHNTKSTSKKTLVPNTFLTFRDYGVNKDYSRYKSSYNYKTRFIVSQSGDINFQYLRILDDMRKSYPIDEDNNPRSCIELYKKGRKKLIPYSSIPVTGSRRVELLHELDHRFWQMLHSDTISSKDLLTDILSVPVSDQARSLVDPVYQTGLIHFNRIFEQAGLDRIDNESIENLLSKDKMSVRKNGSDIEKDLLRIVLLYYLISNVLNRGKKHGIDPEDILCVMFPIKIKGVCWAVAMQAFYAKRTQLDCVNDEYDLAQHRHGEQHEWVTRFLLATSFRRRLFSLIDSTSWEYALEHVMESVVRCSLEFLESGNTTLEIEKHLNDHMLQVAAYLPYGFPEFTFCTVSYARKHKYKDWVYVNPHVKGLCLAWNIIDNPYYKSTQEWNKQGTRSFRSKIELGMNSARDRFYERNRIDN